MTEVEEQSAERHPAGGSHVPEFNMSIMASTLATAYASSRLMSDKAEPNTATVATKQATVAALMALTPADEVEAMLAAQAVGLHGAVMEALRRAAHPQDDDVDDMFNRAADLGRTMLATLDALGHRQAARRAAASPSSQSSAA